MSKPNNLIGLKFGFLSVTKRLPNNQHGCTVWECQCECGNIKKVSGSNLMLKNTLSCGCYRNKMLLDMNTKHNYSKKGEVMSEYRSWQTMKERCYIKNSISYKNYGARGITICDRWINNFNNFLLDMGKKPTKKHSIERIDINKNYEPSNCKWATSKEQSRNKRNNVIINYNNELLIKKDFLKKYNLCDNSYYRWVVKRGMSIDEFIKRKTIKHVPKDLYQQS